MTAKTDEETARPGETAGPAPIASQDVSPTTNLGRKMFRNSAAQVGGRAVVALSRLVIAGIITRQYGNETFGQYSLIFGMLALADWLVDFGTTEVFVREICREPERSTPLLRVLSALKILQIPAAFAGFAALMYAFRYPPAIIAAGLIGATNVLFFAGVQVYRVMFRSTLTIERDAVAETVSVAAMIPMILVASNAGAGLNTLVGCHVISRGLNFQLCHILGRKRHPLSLRGVTAEEVKWGLRSSFTIGVIGLMVAGYELLDLIILSKLGDFTQVAYYSAAQRLIWPVLMAMFAVAATFYPVLASYWPRDRVQFGKTCQKGLETVLVLGAAVLCPLIAGAEFFMGLLGPELVVGAAALRVLGLLCFVKVITSTLGPVLYIVKAQRQVLMFIAAAVVTKVVVMTALAPGFGYMGVAYGALGVETLLSAIPTVYLIRKIAGFHVAWGTPLKVLGIGVLAIGAPLLLSVTGLAAAAMAFGIYATLILVSRLVLISDVLSLMSRSKT